MRITNVNNVEEIFCELDIYDTNATFIPFA